MRKMIFAIALTIGAFGTLTTATYAVLPVHQTCDPQMTGEFWTNDGLHCVEGIQANCDQTHKCFNPDGSLAYSCIMGDNGFCPDPGS